MNKKNEKMESINLKTYLEELHRRKPTTKATNRTSALLEPFLSQFNWSDETFFHDMALLQIKASLYMKSHTDKKFINLLEWAKSKNLHVKQVVKALSTACLQTKKK